MFNDPPLVTTGDGDNNEGVSVMENAAVVKVTVTEEEKPEEERSLESLFEELDRFEDSTAAIETTKKESSSDLEKIVGELQKPEPVVTKNAKANQWQFMFLGILSVLLLNTNPPILMSGEDLITG
ncbi:hypothetical protein L1887_24389 [Cichorium endivia]|nr:hypothetical protein L1887_24389 [Cichorium endivia]